MKKFLVMMVTALLAVPLAFAGVAAAHASDITAEVVCVDGALVIDYTSTAWDGPTPESRTNPQVHIIMRGVVVDTGAYAPPDFSFSGQIPLPADLEPGEWVFLAVDAVADWGDGAVGGVSGGTRVDVPDLDCTPPGGGQGCTPGYWKQEHHFDSWIVFEPGDDYEAVFGVTTSFRAETLLEALKQGGGKDKALGRHSVAALLNSVNPDVSYAFTTFEVIALVQSAYASGDFNGVKNVLEAENEAGCPLN